MNNFEKTFGYRKLPANKRYPEKSKFGLLARNFFAKKPNINHRVYISLIINQNILVDNGISEREVVPHLKKTVDNCLPIFERRRFNMCQIVPE